MGRTATRSGLTAARDAPVGGQAVLEGVMMRGVAHWAVAVRAPAFAPEGRPGERSDGRTGERSDGRTGERSEGRPGERSDGRTGERSDGWRGESAGRPGGVGAIELRTFELTPASRRQRLYRVPLLRGVLALGSSLTIGMRALGISANVAMGEDTIEISPTTWTGTIVFALVFAIGLFFVVPVTLTNLVKHQLGSALLFWSVEAVVRTVIFLGYLWLLSRVRDLRRVLEYHGAEHKVISCYEAGDQLTPARAQLYSRLHPRCGTSFLLIVMLLAIFVFAPIGLPAWWILVTTRVLGVPVIAGLAFELIKLAGRHRNRRWVQLIMSPGLALQKLTTREPDFDQLAVAIVALRAVLARETPGERCAEDLVGLEVVA